MKKQMFISSIISGIIYVLFNIWDYLFEDKVHWLVNIWIIIALFSSSWLIYILLKNKNKRLN